MRKKLILTCLFLTAIAFISAIQAQKVIHLTTSEFQKKIWDYTQNKDWKYSGDKPAIIDLYATWCPPCKKLSPILEKIQKEYGDKIQIYKVDVDKEPGLARLFNASSIPMMVFIPAKGKPFTVTGLRPQEQIEQLITEKLGIKK